VATYTLPTFRNHLGVFALTVESTITGLTTPTENTIRDLRGGNESLELIPGTLNRSTGKIVVTDTPDAFWAQVLVGEVMIRVLLNEGSGNTFAFAGDVAGVPTSAVESYNDGTVKVRMLTITLKSLLDRLKEVTAVNITAGISASGAEVFPTSEDGYYAPVLSIFAVAIEAAFSQSYLLNDAYLQVGSGTEDLQFNDGTSDLDFDQIWFQTMGGGAGTVGYMDSSNAKYWGNYENAWELVKEIADNFGLIPRYDYDVANSRHRIQLLQRGRCFTASVDLGAPRASSFTYSSYMILNRIAVLWPADASIGWYWNFGPATAAPVPAWMEPELEINCIFVCGYDLTTYPTLSWHRLYSMATGDRVQIDIIKYWNYATAALVTVSSGAARLEKALVSYFANRYPGAGQVTYTRTFPKMRPDGGSHTGTQPMMTVDIEGSTYTAIECDKNWTQGEATLVLVKL
jgi:hypothetical protein